MMKEIRLLDLPVNDGLDGSLVVVEGDDTVPFDIKRSFFIYGVSSSSVRGKHANRDSEMLMVAVSGSVEVIVKDGCNTRVFDLKSPKQGLYLPKMTWREMQNFSSDCVLLVLASRHYNKNEYIADYEEFEKEVRK